MTLILTVADASGVCQSSDYQLTDLDTGAPISDRAGSKQLQATFERLDVRLAFTGIAEVGAGPARLRTVDWLSEELKALPMNSQLQDICEALARRVAPLVAPFKSRGVLQIVLTVAAIGEPFRIALISNADWRKRPPEAKSKLTIRIYTITKPFHLISGYRDSVPSLEQKRLRALARDIGKSPDRVLDALAEINAIAAKKSRGYVSEACWVGSQTGDGRVRRSTSRNVGHHQGDIPLLFRGVNLLELIRRDLQAAHAKEISVVATAGVIQGLGDGTPLPPPTGTRNHHR